MDTDIEITSVTNRDESAEEIVKRNFWIPLCCSINLHVAIAAIVGLS